MTSAINQSESTMNPSNNLIPNENHLLNIEGFLTILESVPTYTPKKLSESLVLVRSGGSTRAYFYDSGWRYSALT